MAIGVILVPYALTQHNKLTMIPISPKLSLYTYFLLIRLYGTNKVTVTEVLEMSWFVFVYKPVITFTMS